MTTLFDEIVKASGLHEIVAPFTVSRLLVRAGVTPETVDGDSLGAALSDLVDGIRVYLSEEEAQAAERRLRTLAERA